MSTVRFIILACFCVVGAEHSEAAKPADVKKVVSLMRSKALKGAIFRKGKRSGWVQIVFIANKRRYTMFIAGKASKAYLSVWVRPNGSRGQRKLKTFTDYGLDGQVDFGINGKKWRRRSRSKKVKKGDPRKYFASGKDGISKKKGEQHRLYWQKLYDTAITDALSTLR